VDAADHDHVGLGALRLAGELQRVTDDVGHAVVDLGSLVIVRQHDGVALELEPVDRVDVGCVDRPFGGWDHARDPVVDRPGSLGDLRGEGQELDHG